jgi:hypothetical protein
MSTQEKYVSPNDGAELLEVNPKQFYYYVKTRNIRTQPGESERKTRYNLEDIIRVRKELGLDNKSSTSVDWVKASDVTATVALDFLLYHETIIADINKYASWVRKNPFISLASFDAKDRKTVLAYICLIPLAENVIIDILSGNRSEMDIKAEEIETYDREGPYNLLVESVAAHPEHPEQLGKVMNTFTEFWYNKYPDRYIEKIYAQPVSDKGDILLQKLYFAPRYDIAQTAFMLDLNRPGASRFIRNFQENLTKKKATP